jgi:hypothetical protein
LIHREISSPVLLVGFTILSIAIDPTPGSREPLDMAGGAAPGEGQEALFRLRRGDARERPDL